jgi:hypothetical protein
VKLLRNSCLFFVLFLPAAFVTACLAGFLVGPIPPPRAAYEIQVFAFDVLPLLMPSLLMVPAIHFVVRLKRDGSAHWAGPALVVLMMPLALLIPHLALFGFRFWSVQLVVLFTIPGLLYGIAFRR